MLHLLYIVAFTIIAVFAVSNMIRSLVTISSRENMYKLSNHGSRYSQRPRVSHPELLDNDGEPINEPLLVMRSVSIDEARQQLDHIFEASPSKPAEME